jgi:acetoin utilization deacetylase AcuC-like enzyme
MAKAVLRGVFHQDVLLHRPTHFLVRGQPKPMPEQPARMEAAAGLLARRGVPVETPPDYGSAPRAAVHSLEYLTFLETAHERWSALPESSPEVVPNVFQGPGMLTYPTSVLGQAGYHMSDTRCQIGAGTWPAVAAAANSAVHAARLVAGGDARYAYAACRPPGHHAGRERGGGFCYLNNAAIAAQEALSRMAADSRRARVAILDVDLHHGNGTQEIFYRRDDVLYVSVHADPNDFYPFMAGHRHERGEGPGLGFNCNLPLPIGASEEQFLDAVAEGLAAIRRFGPELLVLSLGFDPFEGDPLAAMRVTTPGFGRLGRMIAATDWPCAVIQEGGYAVADLAANLESFLDGLTGA